MNVLHIIAGIDPRSGGTTTALRNILDMESIVGIQHEVLTLEWGTPDSAIAATVSVYTARPSFLRRYARSLDAIHWLNNNVERFDIFVVHGIWAWLPWMVGKFLLKNRKPFIYVPHGQLDPFDIQKKRFAKKILGRIFVARMLNRATVVLCTAEKEARLMERYGSHPRMEVLPLPVPFVGRTRLPSGAFKSHWGLKKEDFLFLFLSRINYKKGLDILLPAFARLADQDENVKLVIAGSDNEGFGEQLKKWIRQYAVESKVILPGFLEGEKKQEALVDANCFILPSLNENFALAVVEALGAGVPVLISENVYIEDEIRKANAGWVCAFSVESLYATMKKVLDDVDDYESKRSATVSAAECYSPGRIGERYLGLYRKVILHNA